MNHRERVLRAMRRQEPDRVPFENIVALVEAAQQFGVRSTSS